jgi:hypothetical protein
MARKRKGGREVLLTRSCVALSTVAILKRKSNFLKLSDLVPRLKEINSRIKIEIFFFFDFFSTI